MASKIDSKSTLHCSFCGKVQDQVRKFIVGPNAYICNECVDLCYEIILEDMDYIEEHEHLPSDFRKLKPVEILSFLDQYVIGQTEAKKALAVAVYNHYKRIMISEDRQSDVELQKSNILVIGPTGVGKTFLAETLARMLNVPFAIADATSLTEAGYVGEDVENILLRLIQAADGDIARAEKGIIYIDEIDKITRKADNPSITRDVSGEGVQQALLKMLEGTVANVPPQGGRKHPHQDFLQIDTNDILFICGGAFDGLDKIIETRMNKKVIGFGVDPSSREKNIIDAVLRNVQPQDLHRYGLITELIGRLPIIVTLDSLDEAALTDILTVPKNALAKQYKYLFALDNVLLEFEDDALSAIAQKAIERGTGARGLRAILETFMRDIMYEIPSNDTIEKCVITRDVVVNEGTPLFVYNENRAPLLAQKRKPAKKKRRDAGA